MDIPVGEPKPLVQYQVGERRVRVLPAAPRNNFMVASAGVTATSMMATSSSTGVNHRLLANKIAPNASSTMAIRVSLPRRRGNRRLSAEESV
jgi:hypothetical protein